ncbi:MAG: hypothetical protein JRF08_00190 [Deltaproteobacteria bacterium]|nr:hypothetical protein [Deltaproteobacteria bacterium]
MNKKNMIGIMVGILISLSLIFMPTFSSTVLAGGKPTITIHNIIDLTGAYAPIAIPSEKGGKDYLSWIADISGQSLVILMPGLCLHISVSGSANPDLLLLRCGLPLTKR